MTPEAGRGLLLGMVRLCLGVRGVPSADACCDVKDAVVQEVSGLCSHIVTVKLLATAKKGKLVEEVEDGV